MKAVMTTSTPAKVRREDDRIAQERIARFIRPRSVAIVGASESSPRHAVRALLASDRQVYLVNPNRDEVFGQKAYPSLEAIDAPIDAVLTLVNAKAALDVVRQASRLDVGGVAINAAGFAEVGEAGVDLQRELVAAAGDMAVLGPNCNGYVTVDLGAFLAGAPALPLRAGGVGMITHSGGFITDVAVSAVDRLIGFSSLISTGNEAVTDMVDYLEFMVEDPNTRVITLVIESIKRPTAFLDALGKARDAGKPVLALKLGRSERGREVAKSHTGSILGEGWVYDAAFAQHGVIIARDLDDLLDRAMFFDQLPSEKWSAVSGLAVLTVSGGSASIAGDIAESEGLPLKDLESLRSNVTVHLPGAGTMNPIDLTGFVMRDPDRIRAVLDCYVQSPDVDAIIGLWTLGVESENFAQAFTEPFAERAKLSDKPIVLSAVAAARVSPWAAALRGTGVAVGHGLRGTMRGLSALAEFAAFSPATDVAAAAAEIPRPEATVQVDDGQLVKFGTAMQLLADAGVPVAPFHVVAPGESPIDVAFPGPYVVKIADCPHRSDIGGVEVGVQMAGLAAAVERMRAVAGVHGYPTDVAIQPLVAGDGELFLGGKSDGELGPMVVAGLGGIYVEALGAVSGRLAPIGETDADALIKEVDRLGQFTGNRGRREWDADSARTAIIAASEFLSAASGWLATMDVNPLISTEDGFLAVDALMILR